MATVPSLPFGAPRGSAWAKLNCVLGGDSATVPGTGCHGLIGLIVRKLFIKLGNSESTESPAELLLRRASSMWNRLLRKVTAVKGTDACKTPGSFLTWQKEGSQQEARVIVHFGRTNMQIILPSHTFSFLPILWSASNERTFSYLSLSIWGQQSWQGLRSYHSLRGTEVMGRGLFSESREEKKSRKHQTGL